MQEFGLSCCLKALRPRLPKLGEENSEQPGRERSGAAGAASAGKAGPAEKARSLFLPPGFRLSGRRKQGEKEARAYAQDAWWPNVGHLGTQVCCNKRHLTCSAGFERWGIPDPPSE